MNKPLKYPWESWMMDKIGEDEFIEIDVHTKIKLYGLMCDLWQEKDKKCQKK